MKLAFTVRGNPVGKARPRVTVRGGVPHAYTPTMTKNYELEVWLSYRAAAAAAGLTADRPFGKSPVILNVTAYYRIPKSWPASRREAAQRGEILPLVKPDIDNVFKCVADALGGRAYDDDKQVADARISKRYGTPRAEVEIMTKEA